MIADLSAAAAVHVFHHDGRTSRDVLAQKGNQRLSAAIADSSRRGTGNDRNSFTLVKWRLRETAIG